MLLVFISSNFLFVNWQSLNTDWPAWNDSESLCPSLYGSKYSKFQNWRCMCVQTPLKDLIHCADLSKTDTTNTTTTSKPEDNKVMWMTIWTTCLLNWQCKFNVYDALGIRKSIRNSWDVTSVSLFAQDIILSATFFIWTIVTIAIIISWLMFIFAAASGKETTKAKSWLINSLIWLLIVVSSYVIIRLIQYIAKGF